jgi:ribosomal protein S18 acetylase RimI-like enzyme
MRIAFDLRPATPDDLESLFELYRTVFRSHIETIWGWSESWQQSNFRRDFETSSTSVVQVAGRTVGSVQTDKEPKRLYIRNMAVHPDVQGPRIGSRLIRQLQREAKDEGLPVELVIFRTNLRASEFYKRLGFKTTGRTDAFLEMSWHAA